jgi:hypothetical protein
MEWKVEGESNNSIGGTRVVDEQLTDSLTLLPYIQVKMELLGLAVALLFGLHWSVANWECEAGLVVLSRVRWPFVIAYVMANILQTRTQCY